MIEQDSIFNLKHRNEEVRPLLTEITQPVTLSKDYEIQETTKHGKLLTCICLVLALVSLLTVTVKKFHKNVYIVDDKNTTVHGEADFFYQYGPRQRNGVFSKSNNKPSQPTLEQPRVKEKYPGSSAIMSIQAVVDNETVNNAKRFGSKRLDSKHFSLRARRQLNLAQYFYLFDPKTVVSKREKWDRQHQQTQNRYVEMQQPDYISDHTTQMHTAPQSGKTSKDIFAQNKETEQQQQASVSEMEIQQHQPFVQHEGLRDDAGSNTMTHAPSNGADKTHKIGTLHEKSTADQQLLKEDKPTQMQEENQSLAKPTGQLMRAPQMQHQQEEVREQSGEQSLHQLNVPLQQNMRTPLENQSLQEPKEKHVNYSHNQNIQVESERFQNKIDQEGQSVQVPLNNTMKTAELVVATDVLTKVSTTQTLEGQQEPLDQNRPERQPSFEAINNDLVDTVAFENHYHTSNSLDSQKTKKQQKHTPQQAVDHIPSAPQINAPSSENSTRITALLEMPPSFRFLADFPSEIESGDIPVVSQLRETPLDFLFIHFISYSKLFCSWCSSGTYPNRGGRQSKIY